MKPWAITTAAAALLVFTVAYAAALFAQVNVTATIPATTIPATTIPATTATFTLPASATAAEVEALRKRVAALETQLNKVLKLGVIPGDTAAVTIESLIK